MDLLGRECDAGSRNVAVQVPDAPRAKEGNDGGRLVQQPSKGQLARCAALVLSSFQKSVYQQHVLQYQDSSEDSRRSILSCARLHRCIGAVDAPQGP